MSEIMAENQSLQLVQSLPTSGARAASGFEIDGRQYLAIPQLAQNEPGAAMGMNLGDSDIPLQLYRADEPSGVFQLFQELPVPGGEDAEFFSINGRVFLATASLRSGKGPYSMDIESTIFEWDGKSFVEFQRIPTFAAKQWRYFSVGSRHFLALAQGVEIPGLVAKIPSNSTIFEWNTSRFEPFQTVTSKWGYNWLHFSLDGQDFLAYADHIESSVLLRWNGTIFVPFQSFDGSHGRAFCFFKDGSNNAYLAFARISSNSILYRWNGDTFEEHQELEGPGGREFTLIADGANTYLILVKFITGSRENPNTALDSVIYRLENGRLETVALFPTLGGTDVTTIPRNGQTSLVVTESLAENQSFRTDTHIYQVNFNSSPQKPLSGSTSFQVPEFLELFTSYTASPTSIGSQLTAVVTKTTASLPLLVATSRDMIFFPGGERDPSYISFRLGNRGFKELASISHLGPALASLIQIRQNGAQSQIWQFHARNLLEKARKVRGANSEALWKEKIQVEAYKGRESAIASMVDYACSITETYLERVLEDPDKLNPRFFRENYLEATENELGATVPFNAVMIATFFLVGLDISYRLRRWLRAHKFDWERAMVLITGKQGRETSGVTISTSSVAQIILQSSDLQLPVERLYIAPHGAVPVIEESAGVDGIRQHEPGFRSLWNALHGMGQLGEVMFSGYPAYKPEQNSKPIISAFTKTVSELPKISSPDDWFSMNTRIRVVLEDARQLLSGCVTDYAAEQVRLAAEDLSKIVVPGLDGVDYYRKTELIGYLKEQESFSISSCPFPLRMDLPAAIQKLDVIDGVLAYREGGHGSGDPIIWVHGLPLDSRSWTAQYDHFTAKFRNIFIDLRGYGSSSKLPTMITDVTQLYCDDLLALMKHLGIQRATIVGFASAGHVALRFAAQQPDRVSNLILLNASPCFKRNNIDYQFGFTDTQIRDHFLSAADQGIEALTEVVLDPSMVFQDLAGDDIEKVQSWFRMMSYNAGLETLLGFFRHMVNDDDRHLVPLIKAPTLILSSSLGKEVPSQTALFLRQHLLDAKLAEIPDADHFFAVTRPVVVNELISSFLSRFDANKRI